MPAPDFPTAGIIYGIEGVREGYRTGRGRVVIRARTHVEDIGKGERQAIIVDEIPYQVNKANLLIRIGELVRDKKLEGISDLRDESDKSGMRVVIELKRGEIAEIVQNNLFKLTQLQDSFGMNMVALVDGEPRLLNLKQFLEFFLQHRREVVVRRTRFELRKARERGHILEGLAVALSNVDEIIALIKAAPTPAEAKTALMAKTWRSPLVEDMLKRAAADAARPEGLPLEFGWQERANGYRLSDAQAQAILELRLQRLTGLEQDKIFGEYKEVMAQIVDLIDILANPERVTAIVGDELKAIRDQFGDARRSEIVAQGVDLSLEDLIAPADMVVTLSHGGYMKAQAVAEYRAQKRGGRGKQATATKEDDFIDRLFIANTHDFILCFSNRGRVYWLKVYNVPQGSRAARGKPIVNLVPLAENEKITAILPVKEFTENEFVFMATAMGTVKKTPLSDFSRPRTSGIIAVDLTDGDSLIGAALTDGKHDVMLFSSGGKAVRFDENDVRPMGRVAHGVRGMMLDKKHRVISMLVAEDEEQSVLTATENGYGKRTPIVEYTRHGRGTKGMIAIQQSERNGTVVAAALVRPGRRGDADLDRRRADPHAGEGDPRNEPLDAGRHADQPRRRRKARRARARGRARRRRRRVGARPPWPRPTTASRSSRAIAAAIDALDREILDALNARAAARKGDRRAEGRRRRVPARARGAGAVAAAGRKSRTASERGRRRRLPPGDVGVPRAGAAGARRVSRPGRHVLARGGRQALRQVRARRALRDDRRGLSRGRGRADRLRGRPGRELDRRRRRPDARPHVPDAAVDLRRDQAARAPEPAVERRGARRRHARVLACAIARAVRPVARPPPARGGAGRRREQCRSGAPRRGGAGRRGHRRRNRRRDLRAWRPRSAHRGRAQQHDPLLGAGIAGRARLGPRRNLARDVGAQPPGRDLRAAGTDRQARRQHVAARVAAGAHRSVGVPVLCRSGRPRDRSAGRSGRRASCRKKPHLSRY